MKYLHMSIKKNFVRATGHKVEKSRKTMHRLFLESNQLIGGCIRAKI